MQYKNWFLLLNFMTGFTLVTVMKSGPKKTALTPSMRNNSLAKGLQKAEVTDGKSKVPPSDKT